MSRSPRTLLGRSCVVFLLVVLFGALASTSRGFQTRDIQGGRPDAPSAPPDITHLPTDREAEQKLETAREYIAAKEWDKVVGVLQFVLDRKEDSLIHIPADPVAKTSERWSSTRAEADRIIAALPTAGIEYYQTTFNEPAHKMLVEAKTRRDPQLFQEIVRRYRYTKPGTEALELLGAHSLDRGDFELAAVCYRRLLDRNDKEKMTKDAMLRAVLAFHCAGNRGQ